MRTIAILALLGLATAEHINHRQRLAILNNLIQMDEQDSDSEDSDDASFVQGYDEMPAYLSGSPSYGFSEGYVRDIPSRFTLERDDRLMNSLIGKYAREVIIDGKKSGQMFCNLADAKSVLSEVIKTHPNMGYTKLEGEIDADGAFEHFDVNKDGLIEVERMPQFIRYALPNGALDIDLQ